MKRRAFAKGALAALEALTVVVLVATVLWAVPQVRDYFAARVGFVDAFVDFWHPESWLNLPEFTAYPEIYGLALWLIIIVVLQLLTIWPLVVLCRRPKARAGSLSESALPEGEEDSTVAFVDGEGNLGHARIKGHLTDPRKKYFEGLNDTQANQEFDWHNYIGVKPVVRIVLGVVFGVIGLACLACRFGWYIHDVEQLSGFYDLWFFRSAMHVLDRVSNALFSSLGDIEVGSIAGSVITGQEICDFLFWVAIVYGTIMFGLIVISAIIWCFRKPLGQRRADKARRRYIADLANSTFDPIFTDESKYLAVAVHSQDDLRGETATDADINVEPWSVSASSEDTDAQRRISLAEIGTGIDEVEAIQLNVEGNVYTRSALSYTLNSATDDLMLIDPTLVSSIATFSARSAKLQPAVADQVEIPTIAELTPRHASIARVKEQVPEIRPSDRSVLYWYLHAPLRPSDYTPAYWYENVKVPAQPVAQPAVATPVAQQPVQPAQGVMVSAEEGELYRLLANAIEPFHLSPVSVEGAKTSDLPLWGEVVESIRATQEAVIVPEVAAPAATQPAIVSAASIQAPALPVAPVQPRVVRPSDLLTQHWYLEALLKTAHPEQEVVTRRQAYLSGQVVVEQITEVKPISLDALLARLQAERGLPLFLEPENLTPAPVEGAQPSERIAPVATPAAEAPVYFTAPSSRIPDYWYEIAQAEASEAAPFTFVPYVAPAIPAAPVIPAVPPIGVIPTYGNRPSDKTPDYWYGLAGDEVFGPVAVAAIQSIQAPELPAASVEPRATYILASAQLPEYWYELAVHEIAGQGQPLPQPLPVHVIYASGQVSGLAAETGAGVAGLSGLVTSGYAGNLASGQGSLTSGYAGNLASGQGLLASGLSGATWFTVAGVPQLAGVTFATLSEAEAALAQFLEPGHLKPAPVEGAQVSQTVQAAAAAPAAETAGSSLQAAAVAAAPVYAGIASRRSPDYWYEMAAGEAARAIPFYYVRPEYLKKPSERSAAYWFDQAAAAPAFPFTFVPYVEPTRVASAKSVDYWYAKAADEASRAVPFTFMPYVAPTIPTAPVIPAVPPIGVIPTYGNRPSDKTPDYWYGLAGDEVFAPVTAVAIAAPALPVAPVESRATYVLASAQLPEHWYEVAVHEIAGQGQPLPQPLPVHVIYASGLISGFTTETQPAISGLSGVLTSGYVGNLASGQGLLVSGLSGVTWYTISGVPQLAGVTFTTLSAAEAALSQFLEPGELIPAPVEGAQVPRGRRCRRCGGGADRCRDPGGCGRGCARLCGYRLAAESRLLV